MSGLSLVVPSLKAISPIQRVLLAAGIVTPTPQSDEEALPVLYPDALFDTDWSQRIDEEDILHEAALHRGCVNHRQCDPVDVWSSGERRGSRTGRTRRPTAIGEDPASPDVDVMMPAGLRSFGYCEDAAAYTKCTLNGCNLWGFNVWTNEGVVVVVGYAPVLQSRMLPRWVFEVKFEDEARNRSVSYHDLCPNTPLIFFNHYWEGLVDAPDWPDQTSLPHAEYRDVRAGEQTLLESGRDLVQDGGVRGTCASGSSRRATRKIRLWCTRATRRRIWR